MSRRRYNPLVWRVQDCLDTIAQRVRGSFLVRFLIGLRVVQAFGRVICWLWYLYRRCRVFLGRHEVWYWLAAWCGSCAIAVAILLAPPTKVVATVLGILILAIIAHRLEIGVVLLMVLGASILYPQVVPKPITIAGQGFHTTELLVLFMIIVVFVRLSIERRFDYFKTPMTIPLILMCISVVVAIIVPYTRFKIGPLGVFPFKHVYNAARPLFHYLLFFAVAFGLRSEREMKFLMIALLVIAISVSIMMVVQYSLGTDVKLFFGTRWAGPRVEELGPGEEGVTRSIPPGLALSLFLFPMAMALACVTHRKVAVLYGISSVILAIGLAFSFTRNFWASVILSTFIVMLFAGQTIRFKLFGLFILGILVIVAGSMLAAGLFPGVAGQKFSHALIQRFESTFEGRTITDPSVQNRISENRYAIQCIKQNPIFGLGVGTPVHYKQWTRPGSWTKFIYPSFAIHNSYLELWAVYGLLGIVSFAWLTVAFLVRSFILFRRANDPVWRMVALTLFAGYLGFLVRATVTMSLLHEVHNITAVALAWGVVEVGWRLAVESPQTQGVDTARRAKAVA